jgi:ubiquinone/menaquinone biosynthesis C-methylase UbiE
VLDLLAAQPGERIIDFGCGSGELPLQLATAVGARGRVVAVDASESMVRAGWCADQQPGRADRARQVEQAEKNGVPADTAFVCDVQDLRFPEGWKYERDGFDAVFTNAALHWYGRAHAGIRC